MPLDTDYAWLAGFIEGEGTFPRSGSVFQAVQVNPDPLWRAQALFGGHVYQDKRGVYVWQFGGNPARELLRRIYPQLSRKRQQQAAHNLTDRRDYRSASSCVHGHPFQGDNLYVHVDARGVKHRQCKICRKRRNAEWKARQRLRR